jgi:prepilin-type processing-associated H-X9-DG protein
VKLWHGVVALFSIALVAAVFFPVYAGDGRTRPTQCLSNVKQLAVGLQIYLTDSDDRLPARGWLPEMEPYLKNDDMLTCPLVPHGRYGYAMNAALMGIDANTVKAPAKTPLFFETDALGRGVVANLAARNRDRHDGKGSNISYLDSHAKFILKDDEP